MVQKYTIFTIIHYVLLAISVIALFVNDATNNKILIFGIPLWIAGITYFLSIIIKFISWIKYGHLNKDNPIKAIKFYQEYYDKIGFALFTGGIIALVISGKPATSYGLIIIGVTCIVIGGINKKRYEDFEETIEKGVSKT